MAHFLAQMEPDICIQVDFPVSKGISFTSRPSLRFLSYALHCKQWLGTWEQSYNCMYESIQLIIACTHLDETFVSMCTHASGQCVVTLRGHADSVNAVRFLPFSNTLCTCSADKTISLWDARTVRLCMCMCACLQVQVCVSVSMCVCMHIHACVSVWVLVRCCLATKSLSLNNMNWNGWR